MRGPGHRKGFLDMVTMPVRARISQRAIMPGARSITSDCEAEARGARSK